jgi:hypothetical protein
MNFKKLMKHKPKEEPKFWLDIYGDRERIAQSLDGIRFVEKDNNEFEIVVARCGSGRSMVILDSI